MSKKLLINLKGDRNSGKTQTLQILKTHFKMDSRNGFTLKGKQGLIFISSINERGVGKLFDKILSLEYEIIVFATWEDDIVTQASSQFKQTFKEWFDENMLSKEFKLIEFETEKLKFETQAKIDKKCQSLAKEIYETIDSFSGKKAA